VIPMVADYEAKEREKQKEKELNRSTTEAEPVDETEINESKNRVHKHFKEVSQTVNNEVKTSPKKKKKKKKKPKHVVLGQMQGRKRKRESNIKNESREESYDRSFSTPTSSLDVTITHISKQMNPDVEIVEERNVQQNSAKVRGDNISEVLKPIRSLRNYLIKRNNIARNIFSLIEMFFFFNLIELRKKPRGKQTRNY